MVSSDTYICSENDTCGIDVSVGSFFLYVLGYALWHFLHSICDNVLFFDKIELRRLQIHNNQ